MIVFHDMMYTHCVHLILTYICMAFHYQPNLSDIHFSHVLHFWLYKSPHAPPFSPEHQDLQLARAALRSQGAGGLFCRDALGRSVLHHAALGKPQIGQVTLRAFETFWSWSYQSLRFPEWWCWMILWWILVRCNVSEVNNFTGALQERVNASEAVDWVMKQMQGAGELLKMVDYSGRTGTGPQSLIKIWCC